MKKALFAIALAAISFQAAAETPQVELIQKIYREARQNPNSTAVLSKYGDAGLKSALRKANSAEMCLDADPIWDSQDPDSNAKVSFSQTGNQVKVAIVHYGSSRSNVVYEVNCNGNSCKISDIKSGKTSLKRFIGKNC